MLFAAVVAGRMTALAVSNAWRFLTQNNAWCFCQKKIVPVVLWVMAAAAPLNGLLGFQQLFGHLQHQLVCACCAALRLTCYRTRLSNVHRAQMHLTPYVDTGEAVCGVLKSFATGCG